MSRTRHLGYSLCLPVNASHKTFYFIRLLINIYLSKSVCFGRAAPQPPYYNSSGKCGHPLHLSSCFKGQPVSLRVILGALYYHQVLFWCNYRVLQVSLKGQRKFAVTLATDPCWGPFLHLNLQGAAFGLRRENVSGGV